MSQLPPQIKLDHAQQQVLDHFDALANVLAAPPAKQGFMDKLLKRKPEVVRGLYIWGGVGRGKTLLMDHFYDQLDFGAKRRSHFHSFMQQVHAELQSLPKSPDPLIIVARRLAEQIRLLCLDEFHVHDIGDAMLLGRLLGAMFDNGITLVTTSNIPIDQLYKNGLQRERFLPAIELLQTHTLELHLDGDTDYRTRLLEQAGVYHLSAEDGSHAEMERHFRSLVPEAAVNRSAITINKRRIQPLAEAEDVVWFSFAELCETPRSAADYLELSRLYHTLILSDVPIMEERHDSAAQRFIHLIDALYDHNVNIIVSAAAPAAELYNAQRHNFAFQRTTSRLQEMASHEYLNRPHRP